MAPPSDEAGEEIDFGDNIDMATFEQILDMDEDGEEQFSKSIVFGFIDQAHETFAKMNTAIQSKDLKELSALGHFLKGSSATLGFTKVKDECEKIQHYGGQKDETGTVDEPDEAKCLDLIRQALGLAQREFAVVEGLMRKYYAGSQ